jgi:two-component system cell cycle response regulator
VELVDRPAVVLSTRPSRLHDLAGAAALPLLAAGGLFVVLFGQIVIGVGGRGLASFDERWTYSAVPILAAIACFAAARRRSDRAACVCVGIAILSWGLGDIYYTFVLEGRPTIPFPSLADAGYLAFYPPAYIAVGLLVRSQVVGFVRSLWLDGLIALLTTGALASSIIFQVVLRSLGGAHSSHAAVATNLAYPLADILLLAVVFGVVSLSGWRLTRAWSLLGGGFLLFGISDSIYLVRVATDTYAYGSLLDLGWLAAMILMAAGAMLPPERIRAATLEGRRLLVVPAFFASVGLVLEVVDHFLRLNPLAITLASLGLAAVIARMGLTFNEYLRVLATTHEEAVTDALTGLGNRRALTADLARTVSAREPHILLLFDLDGFKRYNDRFGHPAGDALLSRLGSRLRGCVAEGGSAYRLGGDEFFVIVRGDQRDLPTMLHQTTESLTERGEGFHVRPSVGSILLPDEAHDATEALRLVDRRMYQQKERGRSSASEGHGVLVGVIEARDPQLAAHTGHVAELAAAIAREIGAQQVSLSTVKMVAELHDVGKIAIPDAILDKPGPLTDDEWQLVQQHPLVGERIVNRAPGLELVGKAIRATHERWDGKGYPDQLRGDAIPLAAQIVAVADAYEAMTNGDRPYRASRSHDAAAAEIAGCSGTQFNPEVVAAFTEALRQRSAVPTLSASA